MPLNEETLGKLTTILASDIDLFNTVLNEVQTSDSLINEKDQKISELEQEKTELQSRSNEYLSQISNLLSKIPVSNTNTVQSLESKLEEIKNRQWSK